MDNDGVATLLMILWVGLSVGGVILTAIVGFKTGMTPKQAAELHAKHHHLALERDHQREQVRMMRDEVPGSVPPAAAPPEPPAAKPAQPSGRLNADRL